MTSLYAICTMGRDLEKKMERNEKIQVRRAISSIFPEWKVENSFPARVEAIKSTITGRMIRLLIIELPSLNRAEIQKKKKKTENKEEKYARHKS